MTAKWLTPAKESTELNPYEGVIKPLTAEDYSYFSSKYEMRRSSSLLAGIGRAGCCRYFLPIWSPSGVARGAVARLPWESAPLKYHSFSTVSTKALTYMHAFGPVQSFYPALVYASEPELGEQRPLVIVEDQLSAIKTAQAGYNVMALLGQPGSPNVRSYSGHDRVREMQSLKPESVIVALDADATEAAFQFARKWGLAFPKIRVAMLERDLKDTPLADIPDVLGE